MALEEAFLADQGVTEKLMHDIHLAAGNSTFDDSFYRWIQETAVSNQELNNNAPRQASVSMILVHFYMTFFSYIFLCKSPPIWVIYLINIMLCRGC